MKYLQGFNFQHSFQHSHFAIILKNVTHVLQVFYKKIASILRAPILGQSFNGCSFRNSAETLNKKNQCDVTYTSTINVSLRKCLNSVKNKFYWQAVYEPYQPPRVRNKQFPEVDLTLIFLLEHISNVVHYKKKIEFSIKDFI